MCKKHDQFINRQTPFSNFKSCVTDNQLALVLPTCIPLLALTLSSQVVQATNELLWTPAVGSLYWECAAGRKLVQVSLLCNAVEQNKDGCCVSHR